MKLEDLMSVGYGDPLFYMDPANTNIIEGTFKGFSCYEQGGNRVTLIVEKMARTYPLELIYSSKGFAVSELAFLLRKRASDLEAGISTAHIEIEKARLELDTKEHQLQIGKSLVELNTALELAKLMKQTLALVLEGHKDPFRAVESLHNVVCGAIGRTSDI